MAQEKDHKACVHFLKNPQQAFEEARRHSQERKNEELGLLFNNDSVGGAVPESTSKKRKLSSWLKTPKRKVSIEYFLHCSCCAIFKQDVSVTSSHHC